MKKKKIEKIIYKKAKCRIHGKIPTKNCMHCGYASGWNDYRNLHDKLNKEGV